MKKIKRIIIGFIMLFCFLAANGGTEGVVLCFGENGHVAIETANEGFCNKFSPSTDDFNFKKHKNHCVDFILSTGGLYQHIPSKSLEPLITASLLAVVSDRFTPQLTRAEPESFILLTPATNTSVEYLRTVILIV